VSQINPYAWQVYIGSFRYEGPNGDTTPEFLGYGASEPDAFTTGMNEYEGAYDGGTDWSPVGDWQTRDGRDMSVYRQLVDKNSDYYEFLICVEATPGRYGYELEPVNATEAIHHALSMGDSDGALLEVIAICQTALAQRAGAQRKASA
jgi:hypothetical protein